MLLTTNPDLCVRCGNAEWEHVFLAGATELNPKKSMRVCDKCLVDVMRTVRKVDHSKRRHKEAADGTENTDA